MINMRQWMSDSINTRHRLVIPVMTNPGLELLQRKVSEAVNNGEVHYEAIKKLNEVYPADACTVIMDLTVEAEAFGASIISPEDEVPSVVGRLVCDYATVEKLEVPSLTTGRVQEYLKANKLSAQNITDKPILGGCIGPFSLAGRLYDMTEIMIAMYTEPQTIQLLLQKCTDFLITYCKAIKATGVNGIVIAEPAAGLIGNDDCSLFSSQYVKQIVEQVQEDTFMIVLHNCGTDGHCAEAMLETNAMAYHFGNKADMLNVLQQCRPDSFVMGNLDPVGLLKMSNPPEIRKVTLELLDRTAEHKNFVLSTGCDVPPNVPFENIEAMYSAIKEFNNTYS